MLISTWTYIIKHIPNIPFLLFLFSVVIESTTFKIKLHCKQLILKYRGTSPWGGGVRKLDNSAKQAQGPHA